VALGLGWDAELFARYREVGVVALGTSVFIIPILA
jgi:hypothetical protein